MRHGWQAKSRRAGQAGRVGVVEPAAAGFGGYRESGFGREGGRQGIDEFLRTKTVQIGALS